MIKVIFSFNIFIVRWNWHDSWSWRQEKKERRWLTHVAQRIYQWHKSNPHKLGITHAFKFSFSFSYSPRSVENREKSHRIRFFVLEEEALDSTSSRPSRRWLCCLFIRSLSPRFRSDSISFVFFPQLLQIYVRLTDSVSDWIIFHVIGIWIGWIWFWYGLFRGFGFVVS